MADQKANEPSMEEILASIRRIISDSEAPAPQHRPEPRAPVASVQNLRDDVFANVPPIQPPHTELRRDDAVPVMLHRGAISGERAAPKSNIFDEPLSLRGSLPPQSQPTVAERHEPVEAPQKAEVQLLSSESGNSISAAFSALSAAKQAQDSANLDSMAREMLRPMLKSWLDDNLPTLVERLVRAEIERVARGGK